MSSFSLRGGSALTASGFNFCPFFDDDLLASHTLFASVEAVSFTIHVTLAPSSAGQAFAAVVEAGRDDFDDEHRTLAIMYKSPQRSLAFTNSQASTTFELQIRNLRAYHTSLTDLPTRRGPFAVVVRLTGYPDTVAATDSVGVVMWTIQARGIGVAPQFDTEDGIETGSSD